MLSSLSWVPRGAALTKLPLGIDHNENKDDDDVSGAEGINGEIEAMDIAGDKGKDNDNDNDNDDDDDDDDGNGQVDIEEVLAKDLDSLAFYKDGEKDPHLKNEGKHEIFDEDELDDMELKPTDSVVVAVRSSEDVSSLEVYVFDDDPAASEGDDDNDNNNDDDRRYVPHTYLHHDIILPSLPLCTGYKQVPAGDGTHVNLVAVGMFSPGIDIWDVDRVNHLEPVVSLGGYDVDGSLQSMLASRSRSGQKRNKKKKKQSMKPILKADSHSDAVMAVAWNNVQHEYLASGSADCTVKIWDIESAHCATTLTHHQGKVQALEFHPTEPQQLVTGSFDRSVKVVDVRSAGTPLSFAVHADVETVHWNPHDTQRIVTTLENGDVHVFDIRSSSSSSSTGGTSVSTVWRAHEGAVTAASMSSQVAGMLVTVGVDKMVKVWHMDDILVQKESNVNDVIMPVYQRPSKAGALFTAQLVRLPNTPCDASPFVLAYGGSKGNLGVIDVAIESKAVRDRFVNQCNSQSKAAIERRAERCANARRKRREKAAAYAARDDEDNETQGEGNTAAGEMEEEEEEDDDSEQGVEMDEDDEANSDSDSDSDHE